MEYLSIPRKLKKILQKLNSEECILIPISVQSTVYSFWHAILVAPKVKHTKQRCKTFTSNTLSWPRNDCKTIRPIKTIITV